MVILCRESWYFQDIVNHSIFRFRTNCNFFQVWPLQDPANIGFSKPGLAVIIGSLFSTFSFIATKPTS